MSSSIGRLAAVSCLAWAGLVVGCLQPLKLAHDDSAIVLAEQRLEAPNPAGPGSHSVRRLYYGHGTDRRRAEFRDSITITTGTVDGTKLISTSPENKRSRRDYWGFDFDSLPLNGRIWYPDGDGPFPLVLMVHGNHNMKDFSDPGYEYLGELLAGRGFIAVSVDENFLNGNLRGENDARGWMLLRHVEIWTAFNDSAGGPFHGKVDLENIGLIGHSRGGEAVAVAGLFNRLSHYPDDATLKFDFGFAIRALIAIAPIDGQYEPANRPTPLRDVNYLVIHGSHDGDVSAFSGLRQYQRITFGEGEGFKSAIWMYRANHGQWNTVWGSTDGGPRSPRFLDLRGLVSEADQRQFAKVYLTAFLEATLKHRTEYRPMFTDHRTVGGWLPKTMYVTRFQDASFRPLADFSEDVDVTTGTAPGVRLEGDSLSTWKEAVVPLRWRDADLGHNAVWLGWNNRIAGDDTTQTGRPAAYAVSLPDSIRRAWGVTGRSALILSLAPTEAVPSPRKAAEDSAKGKNAKASGDTSVARTSPPAKRKAEAKDTIPLDLTIEGTDAQGHTARLRLGRYGTIRRPIEVNIYRRKGRDAQRLGRQSELVLQTFVIPLSDFADADAGFDAGQLSSIRLLFDRTKAGTVVVTDIGLSDLDPSFLSPTRGSPQ